MHLGEKSMLQSSPEFTSSQNFPRIYIKSELLSLSLQKTIEAKKKSLKDKHFERCVKTFHLYTYQDTSFKVFTETKRKLSLTVY